MPTWQSWRGCICPTAFQSDHFNHLATERKVPYWWKRSELQSTQQSVKSLSLFSRGKRNRRSPCIFQSTRGLPETILSRPTQEYNSYCWRRHRGRSSRHVNYNFQVSAVRCLRCLTNELIMMGSAIMLSSKPNTAQSLSLVLTPASCKKTPLSWGLWII